MDDTPARPGYNARNVYESEVVLAGQGRAPKPVEQRRNRVVPSRGDWVELPKRRRGPIPKPSTDWSPRTVSAWRAWWRDPASTQWTDSDWDAVWALAELLEAGLVRNAAEIRLRSDGLGLSQKGKRDMRWRVEASDEPIAVPKPKASAARRNKLKVV
jgi:hypothetical protein